MIIQRTCLCVGLLTSLLIFLSLIGEIIKEFFQRNIAFGSYDPMFVYIFGILQS